MADLFRMDEGDLGSGKRNDRRLSLRQTMARSAIHPGEHLSDALQELNMPAAGLARALNVPTNRITGILNGQRAITADTALRLGHWFGTSAEFWMNLQKLYELRLAQQEIGADVEKLPRLSDHRLSEGHTCE